MRRGTREVFFVGALTLAGFALQGLAPFLPWLLTVPLLITMLVEGPVVYLVTLALFGELFSTIPLGVVSGVIFLPFILSKIMHRVTIDFSFSYTALVTITIFLQLGIIFSVDIALAWYSSDSLTQSLTTSASLLPWNNLLVTWAFSSVTALAFSVFIFYNKRS